MVGARRRVHLKGRFLGLPQLQHKAIEPLRRALALNPSLVNAHVWLGSALLDLGQVDEGIASLREAVELEPDNADVHQTLARAYWMSKGMVPEGIAELRKAIALNPEAGYTHLQLSMLEALSGNLDAAEQSARQAIELQERAMSGTEGLLIVGAHARLGYVHYLRADYDGALRRVPARAGVRDHERPRAPRAHADRAASEAQRAVPRPRRGRRQRCASATWRSRRTYAASRPAPTIRRRATTWPRCMRAAGTSSTRASIWRCR